jgi:hypothetical protein
MMSLLVGAAEGAMLRFVELKSIAASAAPTSSHLFRTLGKH